MLLSITILFFLWTLVYVYQGGKELNDHVVSLFVLGCMVVIHLGWIYESAEGLPLFAEGLLMVGPVLMWALFWILARRQDAGWRMPIAYCSQLAYAFALWSWGFGLLILPICGWLGHSLWQPWLLCLALVCTLWGSAWVYWRRHQVRMVPVGPLGIRVLQLSDLHVSPVMRAADMDKLIEKAFLLSQM